MNNVDKQPRRMIREDVVRIVGRLEDSQVAAILATGASEEQLLEALTWVEKKGEMGAEVSHPMDSVVTRLYQILETAKPDWDTFERG